MKKLKVGLVEVLGKSRVAYSGWTTGFNLPTGPVVLMAPSKTALAKTVKQLLPEQVFSAKKFKQTMMIEVEHS